MDSALPFSTALAAAQALTGQDFSETGTPGAAADSMLFKTMPAHLYHGDREAISCSMMKPLLVSPAHFQAGLTQGERSSDAKDFGSLLHLLLLQPHEVCNEVAVFPGVADRTRAFGDFEASRPGKLVVDEPTFATARRLAAKVAETRYKGREIQRFLEEAVPEATIYFTEPTTGLRMRTRIDSYHPDITFDLKTTRFGVVRSFARDAVDKDYDLQAFMYSLARCLYEGTSAPKPFVFIAAESTAPHSISTLEAGPTFLGNGSLKFQACAAAFRACSESGYWPDLGTDGSLEIEPWQQFNAKAGWQAALSSVA